MQESHDNTIYVIKRNGSREPFNVDNIRKQTSSACEGLQHVSYEELEMKAKLLIMNGMKTSDIQKSLVNTALGLNSLEKPNYIYVAGRLELYDLYHKIKHLYGKEGSGCVYSKVTLKDYFTNFKHTLSDFVDKYTDEEIEHFNSLIDPSKDKLFSYTAVSLLLRHYLNSTSELNEQGVVDKETKYIVELPQHMFMAIAMFNNQHEDKEIRSKLVEETYYYLSNQYIIPATPQLANGRIKNGGLASCLVTSIDDNLDSIMDRCNAIAQGSKGGAGWGVDVSRIRSVGAPLQGVANRSGGSLPLLKMLDSLALYIDQGGKRSGAVSCTMAIWDSEVFEFLNIKKKAGEERLRTTAIYPAINADDVFMSRMEEFMNGNKDVKYTLFNPYDVKDLCDTYGEDFKARYLTYEEEFKNNPSKFCPRTRTIEIKELISAIFTAIGQDSYPYFTFKDTINKYHQNPELGIVRCGNLCVHGDTKVLTEDGFKEIRVLNNHTVRCWNGKKWSSTFIRETGTSEVYDVKFTGYPVIKATPEHKFHVTFVNSTSEVHEYVTTEDLKFMNKGVGHKLTPLSVLKSTLPEMDSKRREVIRASILTRINIITKYLTNGNKEYAYIRTKSVSDVEPLFMELMELGIESRVYFANRSLYGCYITFEDLNKLLDIYGRLLDDYFSQDLHIEIKYCKDKLPSAPLESVTRCKDITMTYCGKEPDKSTLFFNGVHTGNCQEVMMPANEHEIAVCNLGSLNLARLNGDLELIKNATRVLTRFLDNSIDVTDYPHEDAKETQLRMRSLGLGSLGEAEYIATKKIHFGSQEHIDEINRIFPVISQTCLETSQELAKIKGPCAVNKDIPIRNAYRMCIAPNTQTGLFASTTAGCEPVHGLEWIEGSEKTGYIRLTAPNITLENYPYYKDAFSIDQKRLVDAVAAKQKYVDMSITFSFFVDISKEKSMRHLVDLYLYAWKKELKSVYYLRSAGVTTTVDANCINCAN